MSSKAKPPPSKSSNKSGTSTKPTPKSGSPNKTAAKSGTNNAQTAKSGKTSTPTKDDTIHKLQKDLDVCRHQNAVLRAQFNPEKIREELQKEQIVSQDQNELFRTQIRELMEENQTLKSGSNQQDSKELGLLKEKNKQLEKTLKEANEKLAQSEPRVKALEDMKRTLEKEKMELTQKIEEMKKERDHQSKKSSDSANGEVTKLKSPLKEIEKQKEELESEVQSLRSQTKSLEDINKILEKEKGDMTKKFDDLQQERDHLSKISSRSANGEITKLKSELETIQKQKDELESEVQSLRAGQKNTGNNEEASQIQTLEADNKRLTIELRESKEHITKSLDDLQSAKLDKDSAEKDKEQKDVELKIAIQRIQELETENKGISEKLHNKNTEIENLQDQLKRLSDSATDKTGLEQLQQEVVQLKQEREESRKHKSRIKELEGKCHDAFVDLEKKGKEMKKLKDEHQVLIERKDKTIEELRKKGNMVDPRSPSSKIKEIEDERDELRKRLSEIVSAKMTTNNPDIADLSDEFRPNKLGEMYSELYDNEWTDAFEEVESAGESEKAAIEYLLKILQDANSFIQTIATQYWEQVCKGILSFNGHVSEIKEDQLPLTVKKLLVDLRKKTSPYLKDIVGTVFVKQSKGKGEKEELFRRHCAELCWMMRMQDPPVVLGSSTLFGNFNTSLYKEYTKRGSKVDFIVWPPLHLHENGPILSKGVAQGK